MKTIEITKARKPQRNYGAIIATPKQILHLDFRKAEYPISKGVKSRF